MFIKEPIDSNKANSYYHYELHNFTDEVLGQIDLEEASMQYMNSPIPHGPLSDTIASTAQADHDNHDHTDTAAHDMVAISTSSHNENKLAVNDMAKIN